MSDDRLVLELRAQLAGTMEENQELRIMIAQRDRWISELRSGLAALTNTDTSADFTLVTHKPAKRRNSLHSTSE